MSQQAVSADIITISDLGIFFSQKQKGTNTKAARVLIRWLSHKYLEAYMLPN
jgi:hypothetical protein